jgi:uncharacterized protein
VSRTGSAPANAIFRRPQQCEHEAISVNPNASELEGALSYPTLSTVPGEVHGVLIATHPSAGAAIVREAAARGIRHVWFHRSFGAGSVSSEALEACRDYGIEPIVGGCPLTYCQPVDPGHQFFRWWLHLQQRISG